MKNLLWVIGIISGVIALYFVPLYIITDWAFWRFLFIYESSIPRIILALAILSICIFIAFRTEYSNQDTKSSILLRRAIIICFLFLLLFPFSEVIMRNIFYKTADEPVLIEATVERVKDLSKSSELTLLPAEGQKIKITWNYFSVGKRKDQNERLEVLNNISLKKGNIVLLKGRKNKHGIAIDQITGR